MTLMSYNELVFLAASLQDHDVSGFPDNARSSSKHETRKARRNSEDSLIWQKWLEKNKWNTTYLQCTLSKY